MAEKTKAVVLSRSVSVHVTDADGKIEKHDLPAGRNVVPEHIADHFIVKAHAVDTAELDDKALDAKAGKELAALREANAEGAKLVAKLNAQIDALTKRATAAEAKAAELQTMLDAFNATAKK